MKNHFLLIALIPFFQNVSVQKPARLAKSPIVINTKTLHLSIDVNTCRLFAQVKGAEMSINNAYFLPNDDPSGWKVTGSVNDNEVTSLGDRCVTIPTG